MNGGNGLLIAVTCVLLRRAQSGGFESDFVTATLGVESEDVQQESRLRLQSVDGEGGPAVVQRVAQGSSVTINQLQSERLL